MRAQVVEEVNAARFGFFHHADFERNRFNFGKIIGKSSGRRNEREYKRAFDKLFDNARPIRFNSNQ